MPLPLFSNDQAYIDFGCLSVLARTVIGYCNFWKSTCHGWESHNHSWKIF